MDKNDDEYRKENDHNFNKLEKLLIEKYGDGKLLIEVLHGHETFYVKLKFIKDNKEVLAIEGKDPEEIIYNLIREIEPYEKLVNNDHFIEYMAEYQKGFIEIYSDKELVHMWNTGDHDNNKMPEEFKEMKDKIYEIFSEYKFSTRLTFEIRISNKYLIDFLNEYTFDEEYDGCDLGYFLNKMVVKPKDNEDNGNIYFINLWRIITVILDVFCEEKCDFSIDTDEKTIFLMPKGDNNCNSKSRIFFKI